MGELSDFVQKEYQYCLICGRRLKSDENRKRGMGKVCWHKSNSGCIIKPLFEVQNSSKNC